MNWACADSLCILNCACRLSYVKFAFFLKSDRADLLSTLTAHAIGHTVRMRAVWPGHAQLTHALRHIYQTSVCSH